MLDTRRSRTPPLALLFISLSSFASDRELAVTQPRDGLVSAGQTQSFTVTLNSGDYAQIKLDPRGKELVVKAYDPSGDRFRGAKVGPGEGNFNFVADGPGRYRVAVAASDQGIEGPFTIALEKS